jgi:hypothetical protein
MPKAITTGSDASNRTDQFQAKSTQPELSVTMAWIENTTKSLPD